MRHYRYARSYERDARRENLPPRPAIDDAREPFPLIVGDWVRWEIRPYRRNIRQWFAIDETGEPLRDEEGVIIRAGIDRLLLLAGQRAPRRMLSPRRLL